jgi:hypothetical protein
MWTGAGAVAWSRRPGPHRYAKRRGPGLGDKRTTLTPVPRTDATLKHRGRGRRRERGRSTGLQRQSKDQDLDQKHPHNHDKRIHRRVSCEWTV